MFVQISVLKDYASVLPNRDQTGQAKRLTYGNELRQRVSSQAIKAALRKPDAPFARTGDLGKSDGITVVSDTLRDLAEALGIGHAVRSRHVFPCMVHPELAGTLGEPAATEWTRELAGLFLKKAGDDAEEAEEDDDEDEGISDAGGAPGYLKQPIVLGTQEIAAMVTCARTLHGNGVKPVEMRDLISKDAVLRKAAPPVKDAITTLKTLRGVHAGIDGALFGRMSTSSIVGNVDACVHVAHALTVHPILSEPDWFSVQDDLETGPGAAHTNIAELTSGLFYQYAVIDLRQMVANFATCDAGQIAALVAWLVRAFHSVEPAAKRGSTAPYGAVLDMVVEVGRRQPRSLVAAFQKAIDPRADCRDKPLIEVARERLERHLAQLDKTAGPPQYRWRLLADGENPDGKPAFEVLADRAAKASLPFIKECLAARAVAPVVA